VAIPPGPENSSPSWIFFGNLNGLFDTGMS